MIIPATLTASARNGWPLVSVMPPLGAVNASTTPTGEPAYIGGRMAVIGLRLHSNGARLLIEVFDQAPGRPVLKHVSVDAENGRGLAMIDRLTGDRWGWHTVHGHAGKVVWAELTAGA